MSDDSSPECIVTVSENPIQLELIKLEANYTELNDETDPNDPLQFVCEICGQLFYAHNDLDEHMRIHSGNVVIFFF